MGEKGKELPVPLSPFPLLPLSPVPPFTPFRLPFQFPCRVDTHQTVTLYSCRLTSRFHSRFLTTGFSVRTASLPVLNGIELAESSSLRN